MIQKYCLILALMILVGSIHSQSRKQNWYVSISPTIGNTINTYTSDPGQNFKDSIHQMDRWRSSIGASLLYSQKLENKDLIMFGLQFQNFGFTRKREDYKFLDTFHPEIGIMTDLSQTGGNYINFNYRYQYLAIPVLYSKKISGKSMKGSTLHWVIGGSISALIRHDIRAVLHGITTKGEDIFILEDKKDNPSRLNINFQTGLRLESLIDGKNTFIFIQPNLYIPAFSANSGWERHHLYSLSCDIGFLFKPQTEKH